MSKVKQQVSILAFVLSVTGVVTIACLYLYNIISWANYPDFGYGFRTASGVKVVGLVTESGLKAGMQVGDEIIEINGQTYTTFEQLRNLMRRELGQDNTYLLERAGRRFALTIKNEPIGFKAAFAKSGFLYILGLCYFLVGVLVFLMKPHNRNCWIFFVSTSIFGLFISFLYQVSEPKPFWLGTIHIFVYAFSPAVFIHLSLSFPEERRILTQYPWIQLLPYIISTIFFLSIRYTTPTMIGASTFWLIVAMTYLGIGLLVFIGSCMQLWRSSPSEIVRLRSKLILLGLAIAGIVPLLDFMSSILFRVYFLPNFNYYLPFFFVFPVFVGYSIVKHDLFDIDAIIKRTYGYVLTTGSLAGIYGIFVLISNLAFGGLEFSKSPVFPLIFILATVFLFNPIRNWVQRFIDRVFYRLEYDYQDTVQKISETMRSLLNLDEIGNSIMNTALGAMFIDSGSVILRRRDKKAYRCLIQAGEKDVKLAKAGTIDTPAVIEESTEETAKYVTASVDTDEPQALEKDTVKSPDKTKDLQPVELSLTVDVPLIQKMAEQQKEVTIYDIQEDPFFEDERESCQKVFDQLDATLLVPLIYEDQLIGLITLGRKKSGKFYRREDINLLNILANQSAVAIENAQMVEEVIEKERMEEELSIARDLQVSMLPSDCPQIKGFEIAAYSLAAREVGGDFYDFIDMGEDKAGMVIGDVTGKSVSGALVMSASRSVFRMLSEEELNVSQSMMRANIRLKKDVKTGMFVALLYAVLDAKDQTLTLCSAGQTQPVLMSAKTTEATLVETLGDTFPLGILDDASYEETRLKLESGDNVVLYTDGIVEAMNAQQEIFGFERLLEVVKTSQAPTAESLLKEILAKVNEFAGEAEQHDDLTAIVIKAV
jgi:serine phosphatase RsbU (regulator of sigma subunit)